jgi:hypothetical protein
MWYFNCKRWSWEECAKNVASCFVLKDKVEQDKLHAVGLLTDIHTGSLQKMKNCGRKH